MTSKKKLTLHTDSEPESVFKQDEPEVEEVAVEAEAKAPTHKETSPAIASLAARILTTLSQVESEHNVKDLSLSVHTGQHQIWIATVDELQSICASAMAQKEKD